MSVKPIQCFTSSPNSASKNIFSPLQNNVLPSGITFHSFVLYRNITCSLLWVNVFVLCLGSHSFCLESWEPSRVWCKGDNSKRINFREIEKKERKKRVEESEEMAWEHKTPRPKDIVIVKVIHMHTCTGFVSQQGSITICQTYTNTFVFLLQWGL